MLQSGCQPSGDRLHPDQITCAVRPYILGEQLLAGTCQGVALELLDPSFTQLQCGFV